MRVAGFMSGTSLDGIAVAVLDIGDAAANATPPSQVGALQRYEPNPALPPSGHEALPPDNPQALCLLHARLGEWFAQAVVETCASAKLQLDSIDVIGSHGQTIWHEPPTRAERGATLQLGDPATIAERTGIAVVSDFRTRDVAAGGEGAPLVPWVDRFLFSKPQRARVLQNIGGIANLTRVPPQGSNEMLLAFDTGPGNALMNVAVEIVSNGAEHYDSDGKRAARGNIDEAVLAELLAHPYFARTPPKSTGRELFGRPFIDELLRKHPHLAKDHDALLATLNALTARTIGDAITLMVAPTGVAE